MSEQMKPFRPVFWPAPIIYRDELKPRRKYLLWGERNQGSRTASNYGFLIVAKKGTPSWVIEQEKYESRYWTLRGFGLWYLFCRLLYPAGLCRVECASRAQEIRARNKRTHEDWRTLARDYARSIHKIANYPFFQAAGWGEERIYNEIIKHL